MGSRPDPVPVEELILTQPTHAERTATWTATHPQWGAALSLDAYIARENYLQTIPLARDGGLTQWILTTASGTPDARPVLSSCESLRKPCLVAGPAGPDGGAASVRDGVAHGIASVFTPPEYRGYGYASKMMSLLGPRLANWQGEPMKAASNVDNTVAAPADGQVAFSVLYSDIGKTFYAKNGWPAFESSHLEFTPTPRSTQSSSNPALLRTITFDDIADLCALDTRLLRARLSSADSSGSPGKTRVALYPTRDAILWHLMREDFMTRHIFSDATPTARGALYGEAGKRVWALWTRGYYGGLKNPEVGNTLHILRLVIEDEDGSDDEFLAEALEAIFSKAREEAAEWKVNVVEMWNPSTRVRDLVDRAGVPHEFVEREKDSIASLMWYGEGDVEWVVNEKFGWC